MSDPLAPTGLVPDEFRTVTAQLAANAAMRGDAPAVISVVDGRRISWRALYRKTTQLGYWLRDRGMGANDRVAVLGANSIETLILYYGIQAYGATYCTINTEVNRNHLMEMLDRLEPTAVLCQRSLELGDTDAPAAGLVMAIMRAKTAGYFP